jgi:hypothetical protein
MWFEGETGSVLLPAHPAAGNGRSNIIVIGYGLSNEVNVVMRNGKLYCWMLGIWVLLGSVPSVSADRDPLSVPNRFPLHLIFLSPRPTSAQPPSPGEFKAGLAIDYSSVYLDQHSDQWDFLMDMETTVVDLSLAYGLTEHLGVRLDVPLVSMNAGVLDGFLEGYHDALGVSNYGREDRPRNSFAYQMSKGGQSWVEGESGEFRWADITLSAQWGLWPETSVRRWQSSLLVSVKAPTGDPDSGYGSGQWDLGFFLPNQWSLKQWSLYLMPGIIHHGNPETSRADVSARDSISLFAGAGYAYNERWIWLVQFNYFSSPIETTGVSRIDDGAVELALGFQRILNRRWRLEMAFCEDPLTLAAPDFTVHMGVVWSYGQ